ncbi:MAG: PLD nuclease N-terminal domain-containing protein [Candidatus Omnitrophota bacterium]
MKTLLGLVVLILDIIALVDCLKSDASTGKKLLWILLILFLPVVGMILYFLLGKKKTA